LYFVLRRLVAGVVLVFVISAISFLLLSLAHQDVGRVLLGPNASQALVDAKDRSLGLQEPIVVQYGHWLAAALRGDLGTSWFTGENVLAAISDRMPVTISLLLSVTVVTAIASFVLGVWAAVRRGAVDRVIQVLGVVGYALPNFLVTLFFVIVFAVQLRWFPAVGYVSLTTSPAEWLASVTLPVISLSIGAVAGMSQQVRSAVIDEMHKDYVRTLTTRGVSPASVLLRHVLRNAAGPGLAMLGLQFVGLLGGAVLIEQIFALPGIGSMTVTYTTEGDIPIIMGLVLFTVIGVVIVNLVLDILVGALNPKARVA